MPASVAVRNHRSAALCSGVGALGPVGLLVIGALKIRIDLGSSSVVAAGLIVAEAGSFRLGKPAVTRSVSRRSCGGGRSHRHRHESNDRIVPTHSSTSSRAVSMTIRSSLQTL